MRKDEKGEVGDAPVPVEDSSGNVFADLGLEDPDELLAKAKLVHRICEIVDQRKLNRARVAELLGVEPAIVAALERGEFDGFSTDRLFRFLNALGQDVDVVIRPARSGGRAETRVVSA